MWLETLLVLLLGCVMFDINYFLRVLFLKLVTFVVKPSNDTDTTVIYGVSLSFIDILGQHMTNTRYLKDIEYARLNFLLRTGLYGCSEQGATNIRYRRMISPFSVYKVVTKMVYRDSSALYLEHHFMTSDKFVRATVLSKELLPGREDNKLPMSRDLDMWLKSIETSNEKLRSHSA